MRGRRAVLVLGLAAVGCRGPAVVSVKPEPISTAPTAPADLPAATPADLEPAVANLPAGDPNGPPPVVATGLKSLSLADCVAMAAAHSPLGGRIDAANNRPRSAKVSKTECPKPPDATERESLRYAALDARRVASAEAAERFFKLADAEARLSLTRQAIGVFDTLRTEMAKLRAAGLPAPDDDELGRERGKLLADAVTAEAGVRLLNIDLKLRLGLPTGTAERLQPAGDFSRLAPLTDAESLVTQALVRRPDLLGLRTLYHGLSAENLPRTDALLPSAAKVADPPTAADVAARKAELAAFVAEKEAAAAAEIRAGVVAAQAAVLKVGLARSRVESLKAKRDDLVKRGGKPAEVLRAELEWLKARGDLTAEVFDAHRAAATTVFSAGGM